MPTPEQPSPPTSLPRWLKRNVPKGDANHFTARLVGQLGLQTVCDHAKCPNRMECYSQKTATFMILGDICTRTCHFCSVSKGKPLPPDADEPRRVAEAVSELGLEHVVITCVTRDDLPDGGAEHFVATLNAIREKGVGSLLPTIEVLPSDFAGNWAAVDRLVAAGPDVYNHNLETVPRLFHVARDPRTDYARTLEMFGRIHQNAPTMPLKTGMMLGLGETEEELLDVFSDLLAVGCRRLTLGQYLRPSLRQMSPVRYVPPEEFERLGELARRMGFDCVASGPFVRSSYHAREMAKGRG